MKLEFSNPTKFAYHYSKTKGKINVFLYTKYSEKPQCHQVDKVVTFGPSETVELPLASFSLTRGWTEKIDFENGTAMIY
jgi:hypothetical protein